MGQLTASGAGERDPDLPNLLWSVFAVINLSARLKPTGRVLAMFTAVALAAGVGLPHIMSAQAAPGDGVLTIANNEVVEGTGTNTRTLSFRVFFNGDPSIVPVKVDYATSNGTAVAQTVPPASPDYSDYIETHGSDTDNPATPGNEQGALTFSEQDQIIGYKDIAVSLRADSIREPNERFTMTLSRPVGATFPPGPNGSPPTTIAATGTIVNDDGAAGPTIGIASASATEPTTAAATPTQVVFQLSLDEPAQQPITVIAKTTDGSATSADSADFVATPTNGTAVTFPAGSDEAEFKVQVNGDNLVEGPETFTVALSSPMNGVVDPSAAQATGTILDNESPTLRAISRSVTEGDSGTSNVDVTVQLSAATAATISVEYFTRDGNAHEPGDYIEQTGTLSFPPGTTSVTLPIPIVGDQIAETTQFFDVVLANPSPGATLAANSVGTVTILDNEAKPTLSIDDPAPLAEGNTGKKPMNFAVKLSGPNELDTTVNVSTATVAEADAATPSSDFDSINQVITIPAGAVISGAFPVNIVGDTLFAVDERFAVNLGAPSSNATILDGQAIGKILNDDTKPVLSVAATPTNEGNLGSSPTLPVTVTMTGGAESPVTFDWVTKDDSAISTGQAPPAGSQDYRSGAGTAVVVDPTSRSVTLNVTLNGDANAEPDEQFFVVLSNPKNADLPQPVTAATIKNDDATVGIPTVAIADPAPIAEGNPNADGSPKTTPLNFTVTVTGASTQPINVQYKTVDGSAVSPADYTGTPGSVLTIPTGSTSGTISIPIVGDIGNEPTETFQVVITSVGNATVEAGKDKATGTITDDDATPSLTILDKTFTEGSSGGPTNADVEVQMSAASGNPVTVQYATSNGTGTTPADYAANSGTVTFAPGEISKLIPIAVVGDTTDEPDETVNITLSNPSGANLAKAAGVLTITDDDEPTRTVIIGNGAATEGDTGTTNMVFTVTLSASNTNPVTVKAKSSDGSATQPADYTAIDEVVTFSPGDVSETVTVPVKGDTLFEGNETLIITLSEPSGATVSNTDGSDTATGTINDNETMPALSINDDPSAPEGGNAEFTITRTGGSASAVTVTVKSMTGTAVADDFEQIEEVIEIPPSETTATFPFHVGIVDDDTAEGSETFTLNLSDAVNATIADGSGLATIADDDGPPPVPPAISVSDASATEADTGTTPMTFTVTLDKAGTTPITVDYTTAPGTATVGTDYVTKTGTVSFAVGETSKTVDVLVNGDDANENTETLSLNLSNASGATVADGTGNGQITDDDTPPPAISIGDSVAVEGHTGTTNMAFPVTLNTAGTSNVTVQFATSDGTAASPGDYDAQTGTVTFTPGDTSETINVVVKGDTVDEANETLTVTLSNPSGATIADGTGSGQITDDDDPTPPPATFNQITTGAGPGAGAHVRSFDGATPTSVSFAAFGDDSPDKGGVRVARGDLDGDGDDEIVAAGGPGGRPILAVYTPAGQLIAATLAYGEAFRGGVSVAVGDVDNDGLDEIITGAGPGGGPHVRVFILDDDEDGLGLFVQNGFAGADSGHRGGVNVAAGDLDGDGRAEIVTAHASDGQPTVRTFRYDLESDTATPFRSAFNAYAAGFTGGVNIAAGNLYNDGTAEIVTGPASSGGPHIKIFNGDGGLINPGIFAYAADYYGGVNVALGDLTGDTRHEIVTGAGPGGSPHVRAFDGVLNPIGEISFRAYPEPFTGGAFVSIGKK